MTDSMATSMADQTAEPDHALELARKYVEMERTVGHCFHPDPGWVCTLARAYLARCTELRDALSRLAPFEKIFDDELSELGDDISASIALRLQASEARCAALVKALDIARHYILIRGNSPETVRAIDHALREGSA